MKGAISLGMIIIIIIAIFLILVVTGKINLPASIVGTSNIDLSKVCNSQASCLSFINTNAPDTVKQYIASNPNKLICDNSGGCQILTS